MDLIDEEDVVGLEVGQQRGEVAGALEHRPRSLTQIDSKLVGDDVRERRLAQARRTEKQHVVERFLSFSCRFDEDRKLPANLFLPDVLVERTRAQRPLHNLLLRIRRRGSEQPIGFYHICSYSLTPSPTA